MTTLDIETFFAVLDHGTMTAAAEALFITQPTLTARIQALEAEVGAALFRRGKGQRHITLTEAGQRFLPLARRWQNLLTETQTFSSAERREFLHIIAVYTANQYILPPVYQRFLERGLPVSLWVESMRIYETVAAVARGDADMAIVDGDLHYDLQIEARPLFRESFFLVVPMDLALPDTVHPSMLRVEDEILVSGQPEILQWHDCWYGMDARPLLYTDIPQLAETLPSCGRRWVICPAAAAGHSVRHHPFPAPDRRSRRPHVLSGDAQGPPPLRCLGAAAGRSPGPPPHGGRHPPVRVTAHKKRPRTPCADVFTLSFAIALLE